jgi:hypothetical protein
MLLGAQYAARASCVYGENVEISDVVSRVVTLLSGVSLRSRVTPAGEGGVPAGAA